MLAKCRNSTPARFGFDRLTCLASSAVARSGAPAACVVADMSALLLGQQQVCSDKIADPKHREDQGIDPEIGIAQSFRESTDTDWLKPGRWKHQPNEPPTACEGGYGHEQTGKVHRGNDGQNCGRK